MSVVMHIVAVLVFVASAMGLPVVMIMGWLFWVRTRQPASVSSILSIIGFTLGSSSIILAISTALYARARGGFPYYDPLLLSIYRAGFMLSFLALACSFGGFWYPSTVRRHALVLSGGMLIYWFFAALSE